MKRTTIRIVSIAVLLLLVLALTALFRVVPILFQFGLWILPTERRIESSTLPLSAQWTFDAPSRVLYPPIAAKDQVFIRTEEQLIAVDALSGKQMWAVSLGPPLGSTLPINWRDDTVLFATNRETSLQAYKAQNGKVVWTTPLDNLLATAFAGQIQSIVIDPTGNRVYIEQGRDPHIRAYALQDGRFLWQTIPGPSAGFQYLGADDSNVYIFIANDLIVVNARTGVIQRRLQEQFNGGYLRVMDSQAYLVDRGRLIVRELGTGELRWLFNGDVSFYSVSQDKVYASSHDSRLFALDNQTGNLIWQERLSANATSEVTTIGNHGYVMLDNGSIVSFDLKTGQELGKVETFPSSISPFLGDKGLSTNGSWLFVTFGDSKLFAFGG